MPPIAQLIKILFISSILVFASTGCFSNKFSETSLRTLELGMNEQTVTNRLGPPLKSFNPPQQPHLKILYYPDDSWVSLENGTVFATAYNGVNIVNGANRDVESPKDNTQQ